MDPGPRRRVRGRCRCRPLCAHGGRASRAGRRRVAHRQLLGRAGHTHLPGVGLDLRDDRERSEPAGQLLPGREVPGDAAGGAQLPGQGWVGGGYDRRWAATAAQAKRTAALGGTFVLLDHDLWGADGASISRFPGDNGDWSDYDRFLDRLFADVRAAGITVEWDIWNEPNITLFWNRPISQYFELWKRTYQRIRTAFPNMLIVGPSCACVPGNGGFWTQYLDYVKANNVVPDIVSWHSLPGDPVSNVATANSTLDSRGIAHPRPYQINEYASSNEQNPAGGAWYLARLERAGADGLRANWAGGQNLHNDLASLLTRNSGGQYQPKGSGGRTSSTAR
ncbi:hypothetical protein GCM10027605_32610 [Micromonospora zhanjiangensis]